MLTKDKEECLVSLQKCPTGQTVQIFANRISDYLTLHGGKKQMYVTRALQEAFALSKPSSHVCHECHFSTTKKSSMSEFVVIAVNFAVMTHSTPTTGKRSKSHSNNHKLRSFVLHFRLLQFEISQTAFPAK